MKKTPDDVASDERPIGNSRFTQAMGEAGNVGLLATVLSTLGIATILYFGKDKVQWIRTSIDKIEGGFEWIKKKLGNGSGNGSQKISDIMASLTAASGIGYLIGHLVMVPAFREGWRKADAEKALLQERGERIKLLEEKLAATEATITELKGESVDSAAPTFSERVGRKSTASISPRGSFTEEASKTNASTENARV